jgi:hypothetical protein
MKPLRGNFAINPNFLMIRIIQLISEVVPIIAIRKPKLPRRGNTNNRNVNTRIRLTPEGLHYFKLLMIYGTAPRF